MFQLGEPDLMSLNHHIVVGLYRDNVTVSSIPEREKGVLSLENVAEVGSGRVVMWGHVGLGEGHALGAICRKNMGVITDDSKLRGGELRRCLCLFPAALARDRRRCLRRRAPSRVGISSLGAHSAESVLFDKENA